MLAERAKDAETKVQVFLDQFETSVDNYRRQSRMPSTSASSDGHKVNGHGHRAHESIGGTSLYSTATSDETEDDDDNLTAGQITPSAPQMPGSPTGKGVEGGSSGQNMHARDRSSMALDSLASELESLRTHWETTNKNYRLSDKFDFERTPTRDGDELGESLASWRRQLNLDEGDKSHEAGASGHA